MELAQHCHFESEPHMLPMTRKVMHVTQIMDEMCRVDSEELNRPENKELRPFVEKLKGIKKKIDGQAKAAGVS